MFETITEYGKTVDGAFIYIMAISIVLLLLITVAMVYFVIRYSAKRHPFPKQTHGNVIVEVIWIVIPTIIVISMFFYGYTDYNILRNTPEYDEEIKVYAKMWEWDFEYSNGVVTKKVYVPVGKTIKFTITSYDVLHSFFVPALRLKEDAVPGRDGTMFVTPNKVGKYDIACAEYCGLNHWNMYTEFIVMEESEYYKWLESEEGDISLDLDNNNFDLVDNK